MIRTFEEYKSNNYIKVSELDYRRLINGIESWTLDTDFLEKNVEDFFQREIKLIESLDLDVKLIRIVDSYEDYEGAFWDIVKKIEQSTVCQRVVLYQRDSILPKILITKIKDEYFMLDNFFDKTLLHRKKVIGHDYYKCDQIDGLINCIKDCIK